MTVEAGTPVYQTIAKDLIARIDAGAYDPDQPLCTEKTICQEYHVSRVTAKKALSILEDRKLVYRKRGVGSFVTPGAMAHQRPAAIPALRQEGGQTIKTLALVTPFGFSKGGVINVIEEASPRLAAYGYFFTMCTTSSPYFESTRGLLRSLLQFGVDGILYYPAEDAEIPVEILDEFVQQRRPVIILDKAHHYPQFSSIVCDHAHGGELLTEHLLAYGHRKTCYLSRFQVGQRSSIEERYNGYVRALQHSGTGAQPRFVKLDVLPDGQEDYHVMMNVINTLYQEGVTAIECENDEVAFFAMMCCGSLGIRVPEDMSITGFDNIHWATKGRISITTIDQDFVQIGGGLSDLILQPDYVPQHVRIPVRLIPRASTAPARQKI